MIKVISVKGNLARIALKKAGKGWKRESAYLVYSCSVFCAKRTLKDKFPALVKDKDRHRLH